MRDFSLCWFWSLTVSRPRYAAKGEDWIPAGALARLWPFHGPWTFSCKRGVASPLAASILAPATGSQRCADPRFVRSHRGAVVGSDYQCSSRGGIDLDSQSSSRLDAKRSGRGAHRKNIALPRGLNVRDDDSSVYGRLAICKGPQVRSGNKHSRVSGYRLPREVATRDGCALGDDRHDRIRERWHLRKRQGASRLAAAHAAGARKHKSNDLARSQITAPLVVCPSRLPGVGQDADRPVHHATRHDRPDRRPCAPAPSPCAAAGPPRARHRSGTPLPSRRPPDIAPARRSD